MSSQWLADGVIIGCTYGLFAASMGLIRQVSRFFDFSHAAVYTVGAYAAYALVRRGVPLWAAILVAIVVSAAMGLVLHVTIFRALAMRRSTPEVMLLASLGLVIVLDNVVSLLWGDATVAVPGGEWREGFLIAGARLTSAQIRIVAINLLVGLALSALTRFTRFGMQLRATSSDADLSRIRGIDTTRVVTITVAIASAIAAIVAINNALDTNLTPLMGFNLILMAAVALIVGGIGSVAGAFCGGIVIAMAGQMSASLLPIQWQGTIVFALLIAFIFFRPTGILGSPPKKAAL